MIGLWFYNPSTDSEGLVNKIVSYVDGPFCHCEVQFANDAACSVVMGDVVRMRMRTFQNPAYTCMSLPCSKQQHNAAYVAAERLAAQGQQFSVVGMLGAHYQRDACSADTTFCSKLCVEVLQAAGLAPPSLVPGTVSPSRLHRMVSQAGAREQARAAPGGKVAAIDFK